MKQLILIRHAKSDWSNPEFADYQRPLNQRGKRDAPEMGRRLKKLGIEPQLILLSIAERTKETMSLLLPSAGWEKVDKIEKEWLYLASTQEYVKAVEKMHDEVDVVCICGHNPSITEVINYFTGENLGNVPTCGVGIIDFDVDSWKLTAENTGNLSVYDFPKNL